MRRICKYLGIIGLYLLSFYYTEKVALYVKRENPLYQSIKDLEDKKYEEMVDGKIIDDLYIIPGVSGRVLNVDASYRKMHNVLDEELLVYNSVKPLVRLENNKDKIILRGNGRKNSVSLIFTGYSSLSNYFKNAGFKVDVLISKEEYDSSYEMINNAFVKDVYLNIERYLDRNRINSNLCYVSKEVTDKCKNKYMFKDSLVINHSNFSSVLLSIGSGEIIRVENSLTIEEAELLLYRIRYQNLEIVPLSKLLVE